MTAKERTLLQDAANGVLKVHAKALASKADRVLVDKAVLLALCESYTQFVARILKEAR